MLWIQLTWIGAELFYEAGCYFTQNQLPAHELVASNTALLLQG